MYTGQEDQKYTGEVWLKGKFERLFYDIRAAFRDATPEDVCEAFLEAGNEQYIAGGVASRQREFFGFILREAQRRLSEAKYVEAGRYSAMDDGECPGAPGSRLRDQIVARTRRPAGRLRQAGYRDTEIARAFVEVGVAMAPLDFLPVIRDAYQSAYEYWEAEYAAQVRVVERPTTDHGSADDEIERGPPTGARFSDYFDPDPTGRSDSNNEVKE